MAFSSFFNYIINDYHNFLNLSRGVTSSCSCVNSTNSNCPNDNLSFIYFYSKEMLLKLDTIFTYSSLDFYDNFLHM